MTIRIMTLDDAKAREAVFKSKKPKKGRKNAARTAKKPKKG